MPPLGDDLVGDLEQLQVVDPAPLATTARLHCLRPPARLLDPPEPPTPLVPPSAL